MAGLKKQYFTMIEVVAMLAVLVVLFSAFFNAANAVYRANETFISESKALLLLGNVIEELKVKKTAAREEIEKLLLSEFQHSDLSKDRRYRAALVERDGRLVLSVIRIKDNRLLAEVKL